MMSDRLRGVRPSPFGAELEAVAALSSLRIPKRVAQHAGWDIFIDRLCPC